MSIDIMRTSWLRLRLWFIYLFRKQGYKLCRLFCKSLEEKAWVLFKEGLGWPHFNLFGNENAAYYFLRSCSCL